VISSTDIKIPGAEKGGRKLAIVFTCTRCNTRSVKQFSEKAYTQGVVIATCPGCQSKHLIADNLGFFSDEDGGWNIQTGMERLGEHVKVATNDNVLELSVEEIFTAKAIEKAVNEATGNIYN
jgi:protein import protein ZIM17